MLTLPPLPTTVRVRPPSTKSLLKTTYTCPGDVACAPNMFRAVRNFTRITLANIANQEPQHLRRRGQMQAWVGAHGPVQRRQIAISLESALFWTDLEQGEDPRRWRRRSRNARCADPTVEGRGCRLQCVVAPVVKARTRLGPLRFLCAAREMQLARSGCWQRGGCKQTGS